MARPAPNRPLRWLLHFLWLSAFGVLPAVAVLLFAHHDRPTWPLLEGEAHQRARAFDAASERWLRLARDRAGTLGALLEQLPEGPLGKAAHGTILMFLQRRLAEDRDMDRMLVLDARGHILFEEGRPGAAPLSGELEVAQAAARPALVVVRDAAGGGNLLAAAPVLTGGKLRGVFAVRLRAEAIEPLLPSPSSRAVVSLVEAGGATLGQPPSGAELARLGSEGRPGRARVGRWLAAFAPLASTRAVVVVATPPPSLVPAARPAYLVTLTLVLVLAFVVAGRLSRPR